MVYGIMQRQAIAAAEVPAPLRVLGKLVLEILPAAAASVIGAFLLAYAIFGHPAVVAAPQPTAMAPASPKMVRLVDDEHLLVRDFLVGQESAIEGRGEAAEPADPRAAADARRAAAAPRRLAGVAAKPAHGKPIVVAAAAPSGASIATAQLPPLVIAAAQPSATPVGPAASTLPAARPSLLTRALAVPGEVVAVTLHGVMAIGGIPSWIGHRVGAGTLS